MLKINFRITHDYELIKTASKEEFDKEGDLEGFFKMDFNGYSYGYYHNNPLKDGEEGWELIPQWLESLLQINLWNQNGSQKQRRGRVSIVGHILKTNIS